MQSVQNVPLLIPPAAPGAAAAASATPKADAIMSALTPLFDAASHGLYPEEERRKDERLEQEAFDAAPGLIEKLHWPRAFNEYLLIDAIILHVIDIKKRLEEYNCLSSEGSHYFIYILKFLQEEHPFKAENEKLFHELMMKLMPEIKKGFIQDLEKLLTKLQISPAMTLREMQLIAFLEPSGNVLSPQKMQLYKTQIKTLAGQMAAKARAEFRLDTEFSCLGKLASCSHFDKYKVKALLAKEPARARRRRSSVTPEPERAVISYEILPKIMELLLTNLSHCLEFEMSLADEDVIRHSLLLNQLKYKDKPQVAQQYLDKWKRICALCKSQKQALRKPLEALRQQRQNPAFFSFQLEQMLSIFELLKGQIKAFEKFLDPEAMRLGLFLPEEQCEEIRCSLNKYTLSREMSNENPFGKMGAGLMDLQAFMTKQLLQKAERVVSNKQIEAPSAGPGPALPPLENKEDGKDNLNTEVVKAESELSDLMNIASLFSQVQKDIFQLGDKMNEFASTLKSTQEVMDRKRKENLEGVRISRALNPVGTEVLSSIITQAYTIFKTQQHHLDRCLDVIDFSSAFIRQHQQMWVGNTADSDTLWMQFGDDEIEIEKPVVVPKEKPKSTKRKPPKRATAVTGAAAAAAAAPIVIQKIQKPLSKVEKGTFLQQVDSAMRKLHKAIGEHEHVHLAKRDAAHRLGVLASHLDGLKQQAELNPAKIFGCVRECALLIEQLFASKLWANGLNPKDAHHSHLEMARLLNLMDGIPGKYRREIEELLQCLERGAIYTRYPIIEADMYRGQSLPLGLQWILNANLCNREQLITKLIQPTLRLASFLIYGCFGSTSLDTLADELLRPMVGSQPKANPVGEVLSKKFFRYYDLITKGALKVKEKILFLERGDHRLKSQLKQTWQGVAYLYAQLESQLKSMAMLPEGRHFASHMQPITCLLQVLDEQIECALYMERTNQIFRRHDLVRYRKWRDHQELGRFAEAVNALNTDLGAQYLYQLERELQLQGWTPSEVPRAVPLCLEALQLTMSDAEEDMFVVLPGNKIVTLGELRDELLELVSAELQMAHERVS